MNQGMSPSNFQGQGRPNQPQAGGASPNQGGAARKTTPLRPVSIHMLNTAQAMGDGVITIQGREINQVVILGQVVEYVETNNQNQMSSAVNMIGYKVTDSTGTMIVKQWFEPGSQPDKAPINSYVRAVGTVKNFKGEFQIAGQISPVSSCNEIQYHYLDILTTHLRLHHGNKVLPKYQPKQQVGGLSPQGTIAAPGMMSPSGGPGAFGGMPPMAASMAPSAGGNPVERVRSAFQAFQGSTMTPQELLTKPQCVGMTLAETRNAVNTLVMEGAVTDQGGAYAYF